MVLTIADRGINHYLVPCRAGWLLVDPGWAGRLGELRHSLRRYGLDVGAIKYVFATHMHPDHAGLAQAVKRAGSARLIIHEVQIPYLQELLDFHERKGGGYDSIVVEPGDVIVRGRGREVLAGLGVAGELVETRGHSADSVTLLLADGSAFIGDLHRPDQAVDQAQAAIRASWQALISLGAQVAYPGHGGPFPVAEVGRPPAGE
jgi:endoribonuclease LACTB2